MSYLMLVTSLQTANLQHSFQYTNDLHKKFVNIAEKTIPVCLGKRLYIHSLSPRNSIPSCQGIVFPPAKE